MNLEDLVQKIGIKRREIGGGSLGKRSVREQVDYFVLQDRIEGFRIALESQLGSGASVISLLTNTQTLAIETPATVRLVANTHLVDLTTSAKLLRRLHRPREGRRCVDTLQTCFSRLFPHLDNYSLRITGGSELTGGELSAGEVFEVSLGSETFPVLLQIISLPKMRDDEREMSLGSGVNGAIAMAKLDMHFDCELSPIDLSNLCSARPLDRFYLKDEFSKVRAFLRPVENRSIKLKGRVVPLELSAHFTGQRDSHSGVDAISVSLAPTTPRSISCA